MLRTICLSVVTVTVFQFSHLMDLIGCRISVLEDNWVIPMDETNPHHGLTIGPIQNCHAFICMPRCQSFFILGKCGMTHTMNALWACETLKKKLYWEATVRKFLVTMGRRLCTPVLECKFLRIAGRFFKQLLSWTNFLFVTGEWWWKWCNVLSMPLKRYPITKSSVMYLTQSS